MKERLAALSSHVAELEEDLDTARKDLIKSEEANTKLQRDVREVSDGASPHRGPAERGCSGGPLCVHVSPRQSRLSGSLLRHACVSLWCTRPCLSCC